MLFCSLPCNDFLKLSYQHSLLKGQTEHCNALLAQGEQNIDRFDLHKSSEQKVGNMFEMLTELGKVVVKVHTEQLTLKKERKTFVTGIISCPLFSNGRNFDV